MFVSWSLDQVTSVYRNSLADLLRGVDLLAVDGDPAVPITDLVTDSRLATPGSLFFAVPGTTVDGARFIGDAVARGSSALIIDATASVDHQLVSDTTVARVADVRAAKASIAARFHHDPSHKLDVVGITGTNGKTTTAAMLRAIATYDRGATVSLGTICHEVGSRRYSSRNTTPDPITIQRYLAEGVEQGCRFAVMEVSSHALEQRRVDGVRFAAALFTNFTPEHLDYHRSVENYRSAKARLFEQLTPDSVAVLNADDPNVASMRRRTAARVVTFGLSHGSDVTARVRRIDIDGVSFLLRTPDGEIDVNTRMMGRHNLHNAMAAASTAYALGFSPESIHGGFQLFRGVPGRMEPIDCGQDFRVVVDYAHTDDALNHVIANLRPLTRGRIITVFGCGGDRDRTKRARMARVASESSDVVVITNDNPRTEDPHGILSDIQTGLVAGGDVRVELDRRAAIELAMREAKGGDIVLIAGKGHEPEQILADQRVVFDDRQVARDILWTL